MAVKYTSKESVLEAVKTLGSIVLEEIEYDEVLSSYLADASFMTEAVKIDQTCFSYANLEVAKVLLKTNGELLSYGKDEVKKDPLAVMIAIKSSPLSIMEADPQFLSSEEHALESVRGNYRALEVINARFTKMEKFAKAGLDQNLEAGKLIDKSLIYNNKSIALRLIGREGVDLDPNFKGFNRGMKADVDVCRKFVKAYGMENPKLAKQFRGAARTDLSLGLDAITSNYKAYKHLHKVVKKDENTNIAFVQMYPEKAKMIGKQIYNINVAAALVTQNGLYLKNFKNFNLIYEPRVISAALAENGAALKYASRQFRKDKDRVLIAIKNYKGPIPSKGQTQEEARQVAKNKIKNHPLYVASKKYRKDIEMMADSVKVEPLSLKLGAKNVRSHTPTCLTSVKGDGEALKYVVKKLQNTDEMVSGSLKSPKGSEEAFKVLGKKYLNNQKHDHILIDALTVNPELYKSYPARIQNKTEAILKVVGKFPEAVNNMDLEDRQNKRVLKEIARVNTDAYELAVKSSFKVQADDEFMDEMKSVIENLKAKQGKTRKEEPKAEETKTEEAKTEEPKTEEPKTEVKVPAKRTRKPTKKTPVADEEPEVK